MNTNEDLFADLFAYRFSLLDVYSNNERDIIIKLKLWLLRIGIRRNNINNLILNFYNFYQIPMTAIEINNANVMIHLYNNDSFNINTYNNILNMLTEVNVNMNNDNNDNRNDDDDNNNEDDDTLTPEEFNDLDVIQINVNHVLEEQECSICIEKFELEQEAIKLNCNHLFHRNCIRPHLLNYSNKCPLCRTIANDI